MTSSLEHSFKSRLRNIAREKRLDPAQLWQNLVLERFLVRLSRSAHAPHFILKGGVLLSHYVELNRHTQDLDFLVQRLSNEISVLERVLTDVIEISMDDGFHFTDLQVGNLSHPHMKYPGVRAKMWSRFGKTRFQVHLDLGFGDVITPDTMTLPLTKGKDGALLESEIELSCYPKEFIFAEKLETAIYRGADNSRMKDFHDLYLLIQSDLLDTSSTARVIFMVFDHRVTNQDFPIRFASAEMATLQKFWAAHLRGLPKQHPLPLELHQVIAVINDWLMRLEGTGARV